MTTNPSTSHGTLILNRQDVRRLLTMDDCIAEVERAFRVHSQGGSIPPAVLGVHVDGGGFHVKTAGLLAAADGDQPMFAAKVNANFPGNPGLRGLPTIQGVLVLFDAADGQPLAVLDSIEITSIRTAAASAVAARHLARADATVLTICGCGEQGRSQLRALTRVRRIARVLAFDVAPGRAEQFAAEMSDELQVDVVPVAALDGTTRASDIWITCTPARQWFVGRAQVAAGAFIAAVGADNPEKQEIEPELLAECTVVADVLDQCASIGDLHHAFERGVMTRADVHAELSDVVSGKCPGRTREDEIIVFDSTGTALQDVAAAKIVYQRAMAAGAGFLTPLGSVGDGT